MNGRRFAALALLAAGAAFAQAPAFKDVVGYELYRIVRFAPPDYALSPRTADYEATFYGREFNRPESVKCERKAAFAFIALANDAGNILVAICDREAKRIARLAPAARGKLQALLGELRQSGARVDDAAAEKLGWNYRHVKAGDGEEHHFPVLVVGHGILGPQTLVFLPKGGKRSIVVQADVRRLCDGFKLEANPICADTRGALARLARQVAARLPD